MVQRNLGKESLPLHSFVSGDVIEKIPKSLVWFLRIIGVPLIGLADSNPARDRFLRWMGWIFLAANIGFTTIEIKETVITSLTVGYANSSTFASSLSMTIITFTSSKTLNHVNLLLLVGSTKQLKLVKILNSISSSRGLKVHNCSFRIVVFFILVSSHILTMS